MPKRSAGIADITERPFKIIAFDWDGTAVKDRSVDARVVTAQLEELLRRDVLVVVITGTNFGNIDRQFSSHIAGPHKQNLFVCTNRGSEVYSFDSRSEPHRMYLRQATKREDELLSMTAESVLREIEAHSDVTINIVYDRLNRRKIDLIPEWENPPKSEIDKLLEATERRLKGGGFKKGIKGAFDLAVRFAAEHGLTDARITSDVKHIEVGLTDKTDSMRWIIDELACRRNIPVEDILIVGDEFGPIAGFEGSDFRMVLRDMADATYVSVGKEPNGVPRGIIHRGGGPDYFVELVREQLAVRKQFLPHEDPAFQIVDEKYDPFREREIESQFTVGNGYLGTRGSLPEHTPGSEPATLVAGIYDRESPEAIDELVIEPDWLFVRIYVDGRQLSLNGANILGHRRVLDMRKGVVYRYWRHRDASNRITAIKFFHFASLDDPHGLVQRISVIPQNYRGKIRVVTGISKCEDCIQENLMLEHTTSVGPAGAEMMTKTHFTRETVAQVQRSEVRRAFVKANRRARATAVAATETWRWEADVGQEVVIDKFVSVFTSRDVKNPLDSARAHAAGQTRLGTSNLLRRHVGAWERRWETAAVTIKGDAEAQCWINFAAYHLITAGNPHDERVSISARALSGPIYKGHIFWDSEMYIVPFFTGTHQPTARAMLMYRYHTLPAAREKAQVLGYEGALFAWESTITGEEMTPPAVVAPTGEFIAILSSAQEHHIDSAVAFAVWSYWNATSDADFLIEAGAEMMIETARFWATRVERRGDTYHIFGAMGPDEYHEDVSDNAYTNMMAAWNLNKAGEIVEFMKASYPKEWAGLRRRISFNDIELRSWRDVADRIYRGVAPGGDLIEQFAGYFELEDLDISKFEPRTAPLDIILGSDRTSASQVVKQADVVLILYLLEELFDEKVIRDNFEYYDKRTGHGSSLSPAVYGLVAARLGVTEEATRYFRQAGMIDLANNMGNSAGGVHVATFGGLWQLIVMGFGGVRICGDHVSLNPKLPFEWKELGFTLLWRDCRLGFQVKAGKRITLSVQGEGAIDVSVCGRPVQTLPAGETYSAEWDGSAWQDFTALAVGVS